jgi:endonuclease/exonuclease/phosphatase family metal-dependent hydrolase
MAAEIDLHDGPLRIFNTHLQSGPHVEIRAAQLEIAARFVWKFSGPAVFAGDLNLEASEETSLDPLLRHGFRAAATGVTKPDGGQRFDRLLYRDVNVRDVEVVRSPWSDHFGIAAGLETSPIPP